ncbi:MAG: hypothetical protein GY820_31190 [Gammaproteobacteria bacterium]|nr:hypothetical protein [Gammaproteobacteria bacterium]
MNTQRTVRPHERPIYAAHSTAPPRHTYERTDIRIRATHRHTHARTHSTAASYPSALQPVQPHSDRHTHARTHSTQSSPTVTYIRTHRYTHSRDAQTHARTNTQHGGLLSFSARYTVHPHHDRGASARTDTRIRADQSAPGTQSTLTVTERQTHAQIHAFARTNERRAGHIGQSAPGTQSQPPILLMPFMHACCMLIFFCD